MVVDASVWVSSLVDRDTHHDVSRRWLRECIRSRETLVVPALTLTEVAGAISRRTGLSALGHHAVAILLRTPRLRLIA